MLHSQIKQSFNYFLNYNFLVYLQGLTENFTPGVRQIILAGKVYHKALVGMFVLNVVYTLKINDYHYKLVP